jgi:FkbM family methyltransferase
MRFKKIIYRLALAAGRGVFGEKFNPIGNNPVAGLIHFFFFRDYSVDGCLFKIPPKLVSIGFRSRFLFNVYEKQERESIRRYVNASDRVLELGGCIGVVSCLTNKLLSDKSAHVVVEANPNLIPALFTNRNINGCGFVVENCMVGEGRSSTFYLHDLIVGGSADRVTENETTIVNRSFCELVDKHGRFNVIIIDIEGGEHAFFIENQELLGDIDTIIIEQHVKIIGEEKVSQIRSLFEQSGLMRVFLESKTEVWVRSSS